MGYSFFEIVNKLIDNFGTKIQLEKDRVIYFTIFPRHGELFTLESQAKITDIEYSQDTFKLIFKDSENFKLRYHVLLKKTRANNTAEVTLIKHRWFYRPRQLNLGTGTYNILDRNDLGVYVGRIGL